MMMVAKTQQIFSSIPLIRKLSSKTLLFKHKAVLQSSIQKIIPMTLKILMLIRIYPTLIFSFFTLYPFCISAQTDTSKEPSIVIVEMENGDVFKGEIVKYDQEVILKTESKELRLLPENIISIRKYEVNKGNKEGFEFSNPNYTRYFIGTTGIPLAKGDGSYRNTILTLNSVDFGINNNISIGGGFEFISTMLGNPIWFVNPKIGFERSKNAYIGGGLYPSLILYEHFKNMITK